MASASRSPKAGLAEKGRRAGGSNSSLVLDAIFPQMPINQYRCCSRVALTEAHLYCAAAPRFPNCRGRPGWCAPPAPLLPGTTDPYYLRELTEGQYGRCHARERRKKRRHECCEPARALFHSALFFFLPSSNFSIRSANAGSL